MNNEQTPHVLGMRAERLACEFLLKKDYRVIERNYRIKGGEVDIIAKIGNELVFVEVKARTSSRYGYPEQSVSKTKLLRICKAIKHYIAKKRYFNATYRFDIISIIHQDDGDIPDILHIENSELPYLLS